MTRLLLVGLGNLPFPNTRHSVGHLILDGLAARFGIRLFPDKTFGGFTGRSRVVLGDLDVDLTLFKPSMSPPSFRSHFPDKVAEPLMNITGPAVATARRHTPGAMIVIHDSLDHRPKTLSPKFGGSANGHNGVRSVITALGPDFHRLRVGIGRDGDAASYVLGRLSTEEIAFWSSGSGLDEVCKQLTKIALGLPAT